MEKQTGNPDREAEGSGERRFGVPVAEAGGRNGNGKPRPQSENTKQLREDKAGNGDEGHNGSGPQAVEGEVRSGKTESRTKGIEEDATPRGVGRAAGLVRSKESKIRRPGAESRGRKTEQENGARKRRVGQRESRRTKHGSSKRQSRTLRQSTGTDRKAKTGVYAQCGSGRNIASRQRAAKGNTTVRDSPAIVCRQEKETANCHRAGSPDLPADRQ